MDLASQLAKYRARTSDTNPESFIELYKELKQVLNSVELAQLYTTNDELALLLNCLVNSCPEILGSQLLELLELLTFRYSSEEVHANELTSIHVSLAEHCWKHKFLGCKYLRLFSSESTTLPPLGLEDVTMYFENCFHIRSQNREWRDAAINAALALSLGPTGQRFRFWSLAEFIANGSVTSLPRSVDPNVTCSLVTELTSRLQRARRKDWESLICFCDENKLLFEEWGLSSLVKRALITCCLQLIYSALPHVVTASVNDIIYPFLVDGITLNDLLSAGLAEFCDIDNNWVYPIARRTNHDERAKELLRLSAQLSAQLQNEIYE